MYSGLSVCVAVSRMMLSCWANARGLLVDVVLSTGFCFSRYNGFNYIFHSIRTQLRLPVTHIGSRASVQTDNLDWVSIKKKKKYCSFPSSDTEDSSASRCIQATWISYWIICLNKCDLAACLWNLASQASLNCGTCCRSRWVYVAQAAHTMITFVENPQTRLG